MPNVWLSMHKIPIKKDCRCGSKTYLSLIMLVRIFQFSVLTSLSYFAEKCGFNEAVSLPDGVTGPGC